MKTQQQCLLAIADAYRELVGRRPITMEEVSEWSLARRLVLTPKRGATPEAFALFEALLHEAKKRGLLPDDESPERKRAEKANAAFAAD